ncbi:MAG: glycoside hydrolase family 2 TIM barrel-domain containing protein, partial [Bryobacteraceae bacterium]
NVWLTKTAPVHIAQWGTFVTTPEVTAGNAAVTLKVTVDNNAKANVNVSVATQIFALDANGQRTGAAVASIAAINTPVAAGKSASVDTRTSLANPKLWSPKTPNRYVAVTTVTQNGAVVDSYETLFGIRTFKYDPNAGLFVNGEHVKLNGVCDHHDLGALGTAINFRALQRQVEMLKDMGCNAIRTSHNPPAPELLDLADRYGMLVLDESFDTWGSTKRANDYGGANLFNLWHEQDQRALVRRDRNHPSVFAWSIGNEIAEQSQGANSAIAKELAAIVHSEDPTRPVTAACNGAEAARNGFSTLLDAMGFNYKPDNYISFHQSYPTQFFFDLMFRWPKAGYYMISVNASSEFPTGARPRFGLAFSPNAPLTAMSPNNPGNATRWTVLLKVPADQATSAMVGYGFFPSKPANIGGFIQAYVGKVTVRQL